MDLDGVHHIGLNVRDLDRAEKFYTEVLGFKVAERYQEEIRHLMLDAGNLGLHLFESSDLEMGGAIERLSGQGYQHFAFGTSREEFFQFVQELKEKNVTIDQGPIVLGQGESVHFKDPDGNHLEIRCPAGQGPGEEPPRVIGEY